MATVPAGTWVEIEKVLLTPAERAPQVPDDTRATPYLLRLSGFLVGEAEIGGPCRVRTLIGREDAGTLRVVNPGYDHSFGKTVPELLDIGLRGKA